MNALRGWTRYAGLALLISAAAWSLRYLPYEVEQTVRVINGFVITTILLLMLRRTEVLVTQFNADLQSHRADVLAVFQSADAKYDELLKQTTALKVALEAKVQSTAAQDLMVNDKLDEIHQQLTPKSNGP